VAAVLLGAFGGGASVAAPQEGVSRSVAPPRWPCKADAPGGVRIWWTEKRGDPRALLRAQPGSGTAAPEDGSCGTRPAVVAFLATRFGPLLARQRTMGLPRLVPDTGRVWSSGDPSRPDTRIDDGGSPALDVYLDGANTIFADAETYCTYWRDRAGRFRSAATVTIRKVGWFYDADKPGLEHDVAHELVHVAQCGIVDARRETTAALLSSGLVEGTAEGFAMASGVAPEASFLRNAVRLQRTGVLDADDDGYSHWPFWAALLGAPSARTAVGLWQAAVKAPNAKRRPSVDALVWARFGDSAVQRALLRHASFVAFGGELGGVRLDSPIEALVPIESVATLAPGVAAPASTRVRVLPGRYAYVRVDAPAGAAAVQLRIAGAPPARVAEAVSVGSRHVRYAPVRVARSGSGVWTVTRTCGGTQDCGVSNEREVAFVAIANGRRAPLAVTVTATGA
jgi:hypothetical protein